MIPVLCALMLCGCVRGEKVDPNTLKPNNMKLQSICNLATLECYYHNVAKSETQGVWNIDVTKKTFWIEYTGTVKIGIDISKVKSGMNGNEVSITLPKAEVLGISLDESSYNENSLYKEKNTLLNGKKISPEEWTATVHAAEEKMMETAQSDEALLLMAQNRAKEMIANYIYQLGNLTETEYKIIWIDSMEEQD